MIFKNYRKQHSLSDLALLLVGKMELFDKKGLEIDAQEVQRLYRCEEKFFAIMLKIAERFQLLKFG